MESRADSPALRRDTILACAGSGGKAKERILSDPALSRYVHEIRTQADGFLSRAVPDLPYGLYRRFEETGDRSAFEAPYFERRRRLVALALSAWLWEKSDAIRGLEDAVWAICDEYSWALPAHMDGSSLEALPDVPHEKTLDLFACETAFAFAEIRALLGKALSPIVSERMRKETEERVLVPFLARESPWSWETMRNNWCAVCAGSIGAAALYLADGERLAAILERVLPVLDRFMESFPDDGACLEGVGYWTYGVGFFFSFSELLRQATNGSIDLSANAKFSRVAAFQPKAYLNDSMAVSFADGEPGERYRIGLSAMLSRSFPGIGKPPPERAAGFGDDRNGRWCLCLRDLLWTSGEMAGDEAGQGSKAERTAEESRWLPDSQWLICPARGKGMPAFAAKGGHNGEPHNHEDVGSFQLVIGSAQLLADLGRGEYTKDYFGERRYEAFCASSFGHSLPIVGGKGQLPGEERKARGVSFIREGKRIVMEMDIAGAYGLPELPGLKRRFEYDGCGLLRLRDEFSFRGRASSIIERFVTCVPARDIMPDDGRGNCVLRFDGGRLELGCSADGASPRIALHGHTAPDGGIVEIASVDYRFSPEADGFSVEFEFRITVE